MYQGVDPFSHQVIALQLSPASIKSNEMSAFDYVIKSSAIQQHVDSEIAQQQTGDIFSMFNKLKVLPGGAILAGHVFSNYALRSLREANPAIALKTMGFHSGLAAQPTFSCCNDDIEAPKGVYPTYPRPYVSSMETQGLPQAVWQEANYRDGPLEEGCIYVPVATNHPLYDAFFLTKVTTYSILWILQFTTSHDHRGVTSGLLNVRRLVKLIKHPSTSNPSTSNPSTSNPSTSKPTVYVRWVLVTPRVDVPDKKWRLPPSWNEKVSQNDHRGYFWLQEMEMGN